MVMEEVSGRLVEVLSAAGLAEAAGEPFDVDELAREWGESASETRFEIERSDGMGLLLDGLDEDSPPTVLKAGQQLLARQGEVAEGVLRFLPSFIDDLYAREALLEAGGTLVEEFRIRLLQGDAVDHAAGLVPPVFADAVDEALALNLFAATVALMARLAEGSPAGCLAEEIIAVGLIAQAEAQLEERRERGELTEDEAVAAAGELRGIFELFEDDDVLAMFEMREPGDATLASQDRERSHLGIVDQRLQSWFMPFGATIPTGHIVA